MDNLESEIQRILNCHSAENVPNTPDYILAMYLTACLDAFNHAVRQRETWYGRLVTPVRPEAERGQDAQEITYESNAGHASEWAMPAEF